MKLIHAKDLSQSINRSNVSWIYIGTYLYNYDYDSCILVLDYYIRKAAIKGDNQIVITNGIFGREDRMYKSVYQRIYNELISLGYNVTNHYREYGTIISW